MLPVAARSAPQHLGLPGPRAQVALVHAPYPGKLRFDGLPSSLLQASSVLVPSLRARRIEVGVLDPGDSSEGFYADLESLLRTSPPAVLCISTSTAAIEEAARISGLTRRIAPETLIILGGPHEDAVQVKAAAVLPSVDISIAGEATTVLAAIVVGCLRAPSRHDLARAVTTALGTGNHAGRGAITVRTGEAITSIPFDFGPAPLRSFHESIQLARRVHFEVFPGRATVPLSISKGCTYGLCTFCSEGAGPRATVMTQFSWVAELANHHPGAALYFQDSIFPLTKPVRTVLLPLLRELGVPWGCQVYLPTLSQSALHLLAAHGCTYIYTGIESGSDRVLQHIGKSALTRGVILERLGWLRGTGIQAGLSLMFGAMHGDGSPVETVDDVRATAALAEELLTASVPVAGFYPNVETVLPGTRLAQELEASGLRIDFYRMPRSSEFAGFEDGVVGYNFSTVASNQPRNQNLAEVIVDAGSELGVVGRNAIR